MIALIVCGIVFILSLILFVLCICDGSKHFKMSLACMFIAINVLIFSLSCGTLASFNEYERQDLINNYLNCPCEYHLKEVENYNEWINFGNNLWCKFKIDDRSDWEINIDELLKGDTRK